MGFSDHLDDPMKVADANFAEERRLVDEFVQADQPTEPDLLPLSGPDPADLDDVTVLSLTATVQGVKVFPDIPDRDAVEEAIRQLRPADVRGEMLLGQDEAAMLVGVTPPTLKAWRDQRINLPYYISPAVGKFKNRRIHYRVSDLIRYREFVMARISPIGGVHMPPPGLMGTPFPGSN